MCVRRFVNDVELAMARNRCIAVLVWHTDDPAHQSIHKLEMEGACECILSSFEMYSNHLPIKID